jgi:hypothetical protein
MSINRDRLELLFELLRRPIPWDPIPEWLKLDERVMKQFVEMEIRFQQREVALQQEKLEAFGKMMKIG